MQKTKIEYLDYTWNPIAMRCTPVSDGCRTCWHMAMAKRLAENLTISAPQRSAYRGEGPELNQKELEAPLHLRKPSRIGVQFMGDLFHENVNPEWIDAIWEVMAACPQHIFMVLTKRPQNIDQLLYGITEECGCRELGGGDYLSNVMLGVSVEDQKTADERIPILLQIPAAKRFVSYEPGLGSVDLSKYMFKGTSFNPADMSYSTVHIGINLVIAGGETGPGARPLHPDWVRSLAKQCQAAGVPFFFKSWGEWHENPIMGSPNQWRAVKGSKGGNNDLAGYRTSMYHVGHKHSGHLLDGKEYREFPK